MVNSFDFTNKKRDLTDVLSVTIAGAPNFISQFPTVAPATNRKHEWLEDQIFGRSITATAADSSGVLTVSSDDAAKVKVGTVLSFKGDSAVFQVTAINGTSVTVDMVAANGSTLTDATLPAAGGVFNIISTPVQEGSASGEEVFNQSGNAYNCTQIFRKDVTISGTAQAISVYGNENSVEYQIAFALQEMTRDLNRVVIGGRRVEATSSAKGEAGGLYYFATGSGALEVNATPNGTAMALDSYIVNDAAAAILGAGGAPTLILTNPGQARVLSSEYKDKLQIVRNDDRRGAYVAVVVNDINGSPMTIVVDPDVPDTDTWVLDPAGFGLSPMAGRGVTESDASDNSTDGLKRKIIGELTFEFKNAKQRCCRIKGLMASATAIAAAKTNSKTMTVSGGVTATGEIIRQIVVDDDTEVPTAAAGNYGYRVEIGTAWTGGTNITSAVKGEIWASNGTAWVKQS